MGGELEFGVFSMSERIFLECFQKRVGLNSPVGWRYPLGGIFSGFSARGANGTDEDPEPSADGLPGAGFVLMLAKLPKCTSGTRTAPRHQG